MSAKKILAILLIIVLFLFYLSNISSINTIDELAYVIGLGFDTSENGKLKLSLQISLPSSYSSNGGGSSGSSENTTVITSVDCNSIDSGINLANTYVGKTLNLSYCKAVIFSEEFAQKGIISYVSTLINDIEVRPYCKIVVSKCSASDFLKNSKPLLENLSSKYYDSAENSEKNTGFTRIVTLLDFYNDYYDTCSDSFTMLGTINDSLSENNTVKMNGLVSFHNGSLSGELTPSEVLSNLITSNELKHATISIPSPFSDSNYISLYISNSKSKNDVKIVNGFPFIKCNITLSTRILSNSVNSNYMSDENISAIEEYASSYFKSHIENYLYKTSIILKSDVSKFGKIAIKHFKTWNDWTEYDWLDKYQNSFFDVDVNVKLKSSYLVIGASKS